MTRALVRWLLASWLAVFALMFLPWADIQDHAHWYRVEWLPRVTSFRRVADVVGNVLAFVPLGLLLPGAWRTRGSGRASVGEIPPDPFFLVLPVSLLLAATAELLQVFSHSRVPSLTDLAANVTGAAIGASLVRRRRAARA